jgi:hypothetical protein
VISEFYTLRPVRNTEHHLVRYGYELILAMPNISAADIYKRCLNWNDLGYVNFSLSSKVQQSATRVDQLFYFDKSPEWWKWRLSINKEPNLVYQFFSWNDINLTQLLYVSTAYLENTTDLHCLRQDQPICTWDHTNYTAKSSWWGCRFMSKSLTNNVNKEILDINNWHVDMIDSDAFGCKEVEII